METRVHVLERTMERMRLFLEIYEEPAMGEGPRAATRSPGRALKGERTIKQRVSLETGK